MGILAFDTDFTSQQCNYIYIYMALLKANMQYGWKFQGLVFKMKFQGFLVP